MSYETSNIVPLSTYHPAQYLTQEPSLLPLVVVVEISGTFENEIKFFNPTNLKKTKNWNFHQIGSFRVREQILNTSRTA